MSKRERKNTSGREKSVTWAACIRRLFSSIFGIVLISVALFGAGILLMTEVSLVYRHLFAESGLFKKSQIPFPTPLQVDLAVIPPKFIQVQDVAGQDIDITPSIKMVSIARIGHYYLLANYQNVYLFDTHAKTLRPMEVVLETPDGIPAPEFKGHRWVPTGLAYDSSSNVLYVANYLANNILYFDVAVDAKRLSLKVTVN